MPGPPNAATILNGEIVSGAASGMVVEVLQPAYAYLRRCGKLKARIGAHRSSHADFVSRTCYLPTTTSRVFLFRPTLHTHYIEIFTCLDLIHYLAHSLISLISIFRQPCPKPLPRPNLSRPVPSLPKLRKQPRRGLQTVPQSRRPWKHLWKPWKKKVRIRIPVHVRDHSWPTYLCRRTQLKARSNERS